MNGVLSVDLEKRFFYVRFCGELLVIVFYLVGDTFQFQLASATPVVLGTPIGESNGAIFLEDSIA